MRAKMASAFLIVIARKSKTSADNFGSELLHLLVAVHLRMPPAKEILKATDIATSICVLSRVQ